MGGISTLKELVKEMPYEDFIYYGDSLNAPYGEKKEEEVLRLTENVIQTLLKQNVKAIVIACNTATSVSIEYIREKYKDIHIIGTEPAIKQAIKEGQNRTLVMATPITLKLKKYLLLKKQFNHIFIDLPCPGLAKRIEEDNLEKEDLQTMINNLLHPYKEKIDNIVLGCTHYPFISRQIHKAIGNLPLIDGNKGIAIHTKELLLNDNILNNQNHQGIITFQSSKNNKEEIKLYNNFFKKHIS